MDKRLRNSGLYVLVIILIVAVVITRATKVLDKQSQNLKTWNYSQFREELQAHRIAKVTIRDDRSEATVEARDGQRAVVSLPNDPGLINILQTNRVDIAVLPSGDESFWFRAVSSLFFPSLLLVGIGIFFLLRRVKLF